MASKIGKYRFTSRILGLATDELARITCFFSKEKAQELEICLPALNYWDVRFGKRAINVDKYIHEFVPYNVCGFLALTLEERFSRDCSEVLRFYLKMRQLEEYSNKWGYVGDRDLILLKLLAKSMIIQLSKLRDEDPKAVRCECLDMMI